MKDLYNICPTQHLLERLHEDHLLSELTKPACSKTWRMVIADMNERSYYDIFDIAFTIDQLSQSHSVRYIYKMLLKLRQDYEKGVI